MGLDIVSLRRQLREHCGLIGDDQSELPDTDTSDKTGADTYLNRSYWEILDKYKFRDKEVIASFPTVVGTAFYHIPSSFEALQNISIKDINTGQYTPLDRITTDVYNQIFIDTTDDYSKPEKYVRQGNGIRLWRTPDAIYTLKLLYWAELVDLSTGNPDPLIPREWHEVILFGALARALMGVSRDNLGAQVARGWQSSLINNMTLTEEKEKDDSHRAGLEVLGLDGDL